MTWGEAVGVLRERRFAWYFAARTVSTAGTAMAPVALAFAVLHLTDSAGALAQVLTARTAAMVLFLLVGGVVSDRMSRTTVLQLAHALTALTQGTRRGAGHHRPRRPVDDHRHRGGQRRRVGVHLPGDGRHRPARRRPGPAAARQLAARVLAQRPHRDRSRGRRVCWSSRVGPGWALAFDAGTYLVAILCLWQVRLPTRDPALAPERTSMLGELRDGWSEFSSRTWLWVVVVVFGLLNAIHFGALGVLGPLVSSRAPGPGRERVGARAQRRGGRHRRRHRRHAADLGPVPAAGRHDRHRGDRGADRHAGPVPVDVAPGLRDVRRGFGHASCSASAGRPRCRSTSRRRSCRGSPATTPSGRSSRCRWDRCCSALLADRFDPEPVLVVSGIVYAVLALGTLLLAGRSGTWRTTWSTTVPRLGRPSHPPRAYP